MEHQHSTPPAPMADEANPPSFVPPPSRPAEPHVSAPAPTTEPPYTLPAPVEPPTIPSSLPTFNEIPAASSIPAYNHVAPPHAEPEPQAPISLPPVNDAPPLPAVTSTTLSATSAAVPEPAVPEHEPSAPLASSDSHPAAEHLATSGPHPVAEQPVTLPPLSEITQPTTNHLPPPPDIIASQPQEMPQEDAVMTDALPEIPKLEIPQQPPAQEPAPVPEPYETTPAAQSSPTPEPYDTTPAAQPAPAPVFTQTEHAQEAHSSPSPQLHVEPAQPSLSAQVEIPQPPPPTQEEDMTPPVASQPNGYISAPSPISTPPPVETLPDADAEPPMIPSAEVKSETPKLGAADVADNIVVGTTRPREEDEGVDEPDAKRSRVEDAAVVPTTEAVPAEQAVAEPPQPEAPDAELEMLPPRKVYSLEPFTPIQKKITEDKLKNTKKIKAAAAFQRPVDYVALNIPNYPLVIKTPMDLSTMENKLKNDQYTSLEHFVKDFDRICTNCFKFNGPQHAVSIAAGNLRAYFLKQMDSVPTGDAALIAAKPAKKGSPLPNKPQPHREARAPPAKPPTPSGDTFALLPGGTPQIRRDSNAGRPKRTVIPPPSRDLPYSGSKPKRKENMAGLKFCDHVLDELRKPRYHSMTMYFLEPVDPVALNIPHYYKIIKHPMDIQTITKKIKNSQYSSAEEFKAEFDLIFENCFKFNPPDNAVHLVGKQFQSEFEALWKTKNEWIKKNQPRSQRVTPASDDESDSDESSDGYVSAEDEKEETIRKLKEQLAAMQSMLGTISGGGKRDSPKASGKKKSRSSGAGKPKKAKESKSSSKPKPKKQRLVSYEEKEEISRGTEQMTEAQIAKLTSIITENVSKYKDMSGDDVELEIDDLPNEVQHKLLKYVRSIFPRASANDDLGDEFAAVDDDYEPSARAKAAAAGGTKKKHRPMKKADQERRIAELMDSIGRVEGNGAAAGAAVESSGDEDSESSEEE